MNYVYEFTNKRKVTKKEFIQWFQKKFLYTLRKFHMVKKGDIVAYENKMGFRDVVLEDLLKMFSEKSPIEILRLPNKRKFTKKAVSATSDSESEKMIKNLIKEKISKLEINPAEKTIIKPLYLFLDKEVLVYAKLKGLKFKKIKEKKDAVSMFIEEIEKKHPELKHSIVKSYLELYK